MTRILANAKLTAGAAVWALAIGSVIILFMVLWPAARPAGLCVPADPWSLIGALPAECGR